MTLRLSILLLTACCCYGDLTVDRLLISHQSLGDFGPDVSIAADGVVVLKNGKTVDEAAVTFWADVREKFKAITKSMTAGGGKIKVGHIGFSFNDQSQIYFSLSKKSVKWSKKVPDGQSKLFWDALALSYDPQVPPESIPETP